MEVDRVCTVKESFLCFRVYGGGLSSDGYRTFDRSFGGKWEEALFFINELLQDRIQNPLHNWLRGVQQDDKRIQVVLLKLEITRTFRVVYVENAKEWVFSSPGLIIFDDDLKQLSVDFLQDQVANLRQEKIKIQQRLSELPAELEKAETDLEAVKTKRAQLEDLFVRHGLIFALP